MAQSYRKLRLELMAQIGDYTFEDCVQFSSTFELNNIPSAALSVAVGRNVKTLKAATIHDAFDHMQFNTPAKVYLNVRGSQSQNVSDNDLNPGPVLIFDGYATGLGWQRSTGGANCIINLQHWLADLDYTSALSGGSNPGNPFAWTYCAAFQQLQGTGGGQAGGAAGWCAVPGGTRSITADNLKAFWGQVLQPWMLAVAKVSGQTDPMDKRILGGAGGAANAAAALAALNRISANPDLALNLTGVSDASAVANSIALALRQDVAQFWADTTLWGKLMSWHSAYMFSLVPRVENALITPFCGGLNGEPFAVIDAHEYNQCELYASMPRGLHGVGLHNACQMGANGYILPGDPAYVDNLAGYWPTPDIPSLPGTVLIKDAPTWLSDPTLASNYSYATTGQAGTVPQGNAFSRRSTGQPGTTPEAQRNPNDTARSFQKILDNVAHHWYMLEMLKGRVGELSGRLRFDIAPGSQVRIMLGSDRFLAQDSLALPLYGTVTRVTTLLNSEMQRAGTAFSLSHLRTEAENALPYYATATPPLWTDPWWGATLQDT